MTKPKVRTVRRRRPRPGGRWHLDEVLVTIGGERKYLRRAAGQDGNVLDILVRNRPDKAAAGRFFHRFFTGTRAAPRVIVPDGLRSSRTAHREVMPSVEHRSTRA